MRHGAAPRTKRPLVNISGQVSESLSVLLGDRRWTRLRFSGAHL